MPTSPTTQLVAPDPKDRSTVGKQEAADNNLRAWIGMGPIRCAMVEEFCRKSNVSVRTYQRAAADLEEAGQLERKVVGGQRFWRQPGDTRPPYTDILSAIKISKTQSMLQVMLEEIPPEAVNAVTPPKSEF